MNRISCQILLRYIFLCILQLICVSSIASENDYAPFIIVPALVNESATEALYRINHTDNQLQKTFRIEMPNQDYWIYLPELGMNLSEKSIIFQPGLLHSIHIWWFDSKTGLIDETDYIKAGRNLAIDNWSHFRPQFLFDIPIVSGHATSMIAKLNMQNRIAISIWKGSRVDSQDRILLNLITFSVAIGALLMLTLMSMAVWGASSDIGYGWLVLALAALMCIETSIQGFGHFYIWGRHPWLSIRMVSLSSAVFLLSYIGFSNAILRRQFFDHTRLKLITRVLQIIACLSCVFVLVGPFSIAVSLLSVYAIIVTLYYCVASIWVFKGALKHGYLFISGHTALLFLFFIRMSDLYGINFHEELSPPKLDEFQYMIVWTIFSILIFLSMVKHHVNIVKDQLRWQSSLIKKMDDRVAERTVKLQSIQNILERNVEKQMNFLATMSHELRTPLSSIIGLVGLKSQNENIDSSLRKDLSVIQRMAIHTLELVDEGLNFVRQDELCLIEHSISTIILSELCDELFSMGSFLADHSNNKFKIEVKKGCPAFIECDERKLRQILTNLISNASRYCRYGRIQLRVRYINGLNGSKILFFVSDSGPGMTRMQIERYFMPFVKDKHSTGLGLGLSLVQSFVSSMNATLRIKSVPRRGTTFRLSIPLTGIDDASAEHIERSISLENQLKSCTKSDDHILCLSLSELIELRDLVFSGQITLLEKRLNEWRREIDDEYTVKWILSIERLLERIELIEIGKAIDLQMSLIDTTKCY